MKGQPRPTWTPHRHAWLRELAKGDRDPSGTEHANAAYSTRFLGWTEWVRGPGNRVAGKERLTAEGLAVLARWNNGETTPPPSIPRKVELGPFVTRIGFAMHGATLVDLADWLVATDQAGDLLAMLVARAPTAGLEVAKRAHDQVKAAARFEPGGQGAVGLRPGEVAAILREGVASGEIGADPGLEVGGTTHGKVVTVTAQEDLERGDLVTTDGARAPRETEAIDAQPVRAPQYGQRPPASPAASMGAPTMPRGYSACLACTGKGKTGHGWTCQACHGSGKIRRTVPL